MSHLVGNPGPAMLVDRVGVGKCLK